MSATDKRMKNIRREEQRLSHAAADKRDVIVATRKAQKQVSRGSGGCGVWRDGAWLFCRCTHIVHAQHPTSPPPLPRPCTPPECFRRRRK